VLQDAAIIFSAADYSYRNANGRVERKVTQAQRRCHEISLFAGGC
jgi:hypothetical protein